MKSTQAMRDRIRELMSREQDDYDRAVECVLDDLEALLGSAQEPPPHASWSDADYARARDCMIGLLRGHGWTISEGSKGVGEFDNAFQHAVGILSLSNQGASK